MLELEALYHEMRRYGQLVNLELSSVKGQALKGPSVREPRWLY